MSKYIKLEDAKKIIMGGVCTDTDADKECVCDLLSNLATIEVSEDCISREYMLEKAQEWKNMYPDSDTAREALTMLMNEIDNAPSVVPSRVEPKRGEWIDEAEAYPIGNPYGCYKCDQCGDIVPDKTNFCPNCGADMRGDEE